MSKKSSIISTTFEGDVITFNVKDAGTIALDLSKVSTENASHAMRHGFIQRISDAAAMSRNPADGSPASPEAKLVAMTRLVEHYESGTPDWSRVREAGPKGGFLFEALCEMYPGKTPEDIRAFLDGLSDKEQAALRDDDQVEPIIKRIKAVRATGPTPDTKALLTGLA